MSTGQDARARRGPASVVVVVAMVASALVGCGADVEGKEAARAADAFTRAETADPSAACDRLAPRTLEAVEGDGPSCPQELAGAGLPEAGERRDVTVAGHSAQVRYEHDTVFLALFDDGWRVTAAGCRRVSADPAVPYECAVDGG